MHTHFTLPTINILLDLLTFPSRVVRTSGLCKTEYHGLHDHVYA
jgi:hypothetical protein